jgi:hypothetical protein
MRTIAFLAGDQSFDGESVRRMPAGGIHHATVSLAEAFARAGNQVSVYNGTPQRAEISGVHWMPLSAMRDIEADLVLANNNARMFHSVASGTKVVWFHNPVAVRHHFKRGNLFPVLKHRPHAVFLGRYHEQSASRLLPFASRRTIGYAHSTEFVRHNAAAAPPPRAVFTSQAYRGLKWVLDLWAKHVWPSVPNAEFHFFAQAKDVAVEDYRRFGVVPRERMARAELAQELMGARLLFCPVIAMKPIALPPPRRHWPACLSSRAASARWPSGFSMASTATSRPIRSPLPVMPSCCFPKTTRGCRCTRERSQDEISARGMTGSRSGPRHSCAEFHCEQQTTMAPLARGPVQPRSPTWFSSYVLLARRVLRGARGLRVVVWRLAIPQQMPSAALGSAKYFAAGSTAIAETYNAGYAFGCRSIRGAVAASAMAIMLSMARMARAT